MTTRSGRSAAVQADVIKPREVRNEDHKSTKGVAR